MITVVATDLGTPSLNSKVKVTIVVKDVNDNDPEFENNPYSVKIMENTGTQANVVALRANDRDAGDNGVVSYKMVSGDTSFFVLDLNTGQLKTLNNLDRESKSRYTIVVQAYDHGSKQRQKNVDVLVTVIDANDNKPQIITPLSIPAVNESTTIGTLISTFKAADKDEGVNAEIEYRKTEENNGDFFTIDKVTGALKLKNQLQREVKAKHSLTIIVVDKGSPSLTEYKTYKVIVSDANNQPPIFKLNKYTGK